MHKIFHDFIHHYNTIIHHHLRCHEILGFSLTDVLYEILVSSFDKHGHLILLFFFIYVRG
jgi:hypothetical protein